MNNLIFSYGFDCLLFAQRAARAVPKKSSGSVDMTSVMMIIIGVALVAVIATVAYYVISNLRKNIKESEEPPSLSDHLTTFQEARVEGSMTTQEYNKVKTLLSNKIVREVRQAGAPKEPDDDGPKFIPK